MSIPETASQAPARSRSHWLSLLPIAIFDIAGPLVAYSLLRSAGLSTVSALVLSGVFPAIWVLWGIARHRRLDAIGGLVLLGIAVGTVLGLASGNARLVLLEGSVPTAVFGVVCLGSLWSSRPLIFRFAHEFIGPDTDQGREFESRWRYPGFRRVFRNMTIAWGVAYILEAVARIVIVELTSTGTALAISKVMPYAVAGVLVLWMMLYGNRARRKGERMAAEAASAANATSPASTGRTETTAGADVTAEARADQPT